MIHVLNGDSLLDRFPLDIKGERIVARECLIEGDVSGENLAEFYLNRATFLERTYGTQQTEYLHNSQKEFEKILKLNTEEEVYCWFEKDLFCQVNFWFVCHLLHENRQQNVFLVLAENLDFGFSSYNEEELKLLYRKKTSLDSTDLEGFSKLWSAYQTKNSDKLQEAAKKLTPKFSFLEEVITAEIEKNPIDKMGRPMKVLEELILSRNSTDFKQIFPEFSKRLPIYGYGDLQIIHMINEWEEKYLTINKTLWNKKAPIHFNSKFYDNHTFLTTLNSLNSIEIGLLGNIEGLKVLHLQCHFGQDTISLQKLGAQTTGVDFSEQAIEKARELSEQSETFPDFICSDIYELDKKLEGQYDLIFTSYGTIGWLPDLRKWAKIVDHFLKPGGKFLLVEFHPMIWIFDENFEKIVYPYFNRTAIVEKEEYSYTDGDPIQLNSVTWNHPLSEVFTSLLEENLIIDDFQEYDYSPYDCFSKTVKIDKNMFQIQGMEGKLPMVYSLKVSKPT
ncbi:class I SAM-dependent methyltransferase [Namhaeicola litoreus]|uniref:Class I SAM-dependent methyltransferase n=1 Tax=Namhaeicola litoreus TaxID=1052145 RepID=A0ABW3XY91_9FLAO